MADYTTITSASTDPGKPGTSALFKALEENPRAMFEGATGAPRFGLLALERPTAGDNIKLERTSVSSVSGTTYTSALEYVSVQDGTIRITYDHRAPTGSTSETRVLINGSAVYSVTTGSSTFQARTTDQVIAVGDLIQIQHRINTTVGGNSSELRLARVRTGGAYVLPFKDIGLEVMNT